MAKKNYFGHVFFRAQYRSLVDGGVMIEMVFDDDDEDYNGEAW